MPTPAAVMAEGGPWPLPRLAVGGSGPPRPPGARGAGGDGVAAAGSASSGRATGGCGSVAALEDGGCADAAGVWGSPPSAGCRVGTRGTRIAWGVAGLGLADWPQSRPGPEAEPMAGRGRPPRPLERRIAGHDSPRRQRASARQIRVCQPPWSPTGARDRGQGSQRCPGPRRRWRSAATPAAPGSSVMVNGRATWTAWGFAETMSHSSGAGNDALLSPHWAGCHHT